MFALGSGALAHQESSASQDSLDSAGSGSSKRAWPRRMAKFLSACSGTLSSAGSGELPEAHPGMMRGGLTIWDWVPLDTTLGQA